MGMNIKMETVSDIARKRFNVACRCGRCGHKAVVDGLKLARWFHYHMWSSHIDEIARRVRCSKCRAKVPDVTITTALPSNPKWMDSESNWKDLHRRLRG